MLKNESTSALKSLLFVRDFVCMDTAEPSGYLHFFTCASYIGDKKVKWNTEENYGAFQHSLMDFGLIKQQMNYKETNAKL